MLHADALLEISAEAARWREIPGVSVAIARGDDVRTAAYGRLNIVTGIPVEEDAIFQIGSVTKLFTGTLVMQLVEEGRIELDAPVRRYLPELCIAASPVIDAVTISTLLTHTSGITGDFFVDTGRNDDAMERYVERCAELEYLTAPGRFSYCNSGYAILGRLIEVLTGGTYLQALQTRLLDPLGIVALLDPEKTALYRVAAGHVLDEHGVLELTPNPVMPRGIEAAGSRVGMSAASLLRFGRMHLRGGTAADGTRLLSKTAVLAMRETQIVLPIPFGETDAYGLSWALRTAHAPPSAGHNGSTIGQAAFFRIYPELDFAIAVLANATTGGATEAFDEIVRAALDALGVKSEPAAQEADPGTVVDRHPLVGNYDTYMERITVAVANGALVATATPHNNENLTPLPPRHLTLTPIDEHRFLVTNTIDRGSSVCGFTDFESGVPQFLFWGGRLAKRKANAQAH